MFARWLPVITRASSTNSGRCITFSRCHRIGLPGLGLVAGTAARSSSTGPAAFCDDSSDLLLRLSRVDTCALCDASEKKARVISTVKPLKNGYRMVGRARTVSIDGDFLEVLVAIHEAEPGDVIMIDAGLRGGVQDAAWPRAGGMFGELLASEAQRRGVKGLVIDGNCRDTPVLLAMSLPVYSRGRHPNAGTAIRRGQSQVTIQMGGVVINPGDMVVGDDDGVVVCSLEEAKMWIPKAEAIQRVESRMLEHIQGGGSLFQKIPNFEEHLAALARGEDSKLKFE